MPKHPHPQRKPMFMKQWLYPDLPTSLWKDLLYSALCCFFLCPFFALFFLRRPSWTSELFSAGLFLATYSLLWISVTFIFSPESSCCCGLLVNHFNCIPLRLRQIQDSQLWYSVSFSEPKTYLNRCLIPCVQQVMKEYENGTEVWVIKWENISSPLWLFILPVGLLSGRKGPARIWSVFLCPSSWTGVRRGGKWQVA